MEASVGSFMRSAGSTGNFGTDLRARTVFSVVTASSGGYDEQASAPPGRSSRSLSSLPALNGPLSTLYSIFCPFTRNELAGQPTRSLTGLESGPAAVRTCYAEMITSCAGAATGSFS